MVAGAGIVAVPDAVLVVAMGRAHARIHIEHDASWRTASMHAIDPLTGKIARAERFFSAVSQRVSKRPIWLADAAHPEAAFPPTIQRVAESWRSRSASLTSSYPARRPKTDCRNIPSVTAIIAGARVSEPLARHRGKAECVVKFAIGKQPRSRPNRETGASIAGRNRA